MSKVVDNKAFDFVLSVEKIVDSKISRENNFNNKALLSFVEACAYLGIGTTKGQELVNENKLPFTLEFGAKKFPRKALDEMIEENTIIAI